MVRLRERLRAWADRVVSALAAVVQATEETDSSMPDHLTTSDLHGWTFPDTGYDSRAENRPYGDVFTEFIDEQLDDDVAVVDTRANRDNYPPKLNARFIASDTGERFLGDGSNWQDFPYPTPEVTPPPASTYEAGGSDPLNVTDLAGDLADPQDAKAHWTTHEAGGSDEISVAGLSGTLADPQPPQTHDNTAHSATYATTSEVPNAVAIEDDGAAVQADTSGLNFTTDLAVTTNADNTVSVAYTGGSTAPASTYEAGGSDPLNVTDLAGDLADPQDPKTHGNAAHATAYAAQSDVPNAVDIEDDGLLVQSDTAGINYGTDLGVTDNADGTVTVDFTGSSSYAPATYYQAGGTDPLNVTGLSGDLADPQTPQTHATSHQQGGTDELNVGGLAGTLADPQPPQAHGNTSHTDPYLATNQSGTIAGDLTLDGVGRTLYVGTGGGPNAVAFGNETGEAVPHLTYRTTTDEYVFEDDVGTNLLNVPLNAATKPHIAGDTLATEPWVEANFASGGATGGMRVLNVVEDYGADPTGATPSDAALDAAHADAQPGDMIYFPGGVYLWEQRHDFEIDHIWYYGRGARFLCRRASTNRQGGDEETFHVGAFDSQQGENPYTQTQALTAATGKGDDTIPVADASVFSVGDDVALEVGTPQQTGYKLEYDEVQSVDTTANTVTVVGAFERGFPDTASLHVVQMTEGIRIEGITFDGYDTTQAAGTAEAGHVHAVYCKDLSIVDCKSEDFYYYSFRAMRCWRSAFVRLTCSNAQAFGGGQGEPIQIEDGGDITIDNVRLYECRRGLDFAQDVSNCYVENPVIKHFQHGGITMHGGKATHNVHVEGGTLIAAPEADAPSVEVSQTSTGFHMSGTRIVTNLHGVEAKAPCVIEGCEFEMIDGTAGGVRCILITGDNVTVRDCTVDAPNLDNWTGALRIDTTRGPVENVVVENLDVSFSGTAPNGNYEPPVVISASGATGDGISNVRLSGRIETDQNHTDPAIHLWPDAGKIEDVELEMDVVNHGGEGVQIRTDAAGNGAGIERLTLRDCKMETAGPCLQTYSTSVLNICKELRVKDCHLTAANGQAVDLNHGAEELVYLRDNVLSSVNLSGSNTDADWFLSANEIGGTPQPDAGEDVAVIAPTVIENFENGTLDATTNPTASTVTTAASYSGKYGLHLDGSGTADWIRWEAPTRMIGPDDKWWYWWSTTDNANTFKVAFCINSPSGDITERYEINHYFGTTVDGYDSALEVVARGAAGSNYIDAGNGAATSDVTAKRFNTVPETWYRTVVDGTYSVDQWRIHIDRGPGTEKTHCDFWTDHETTYQYPGGDHAIRVAPGVDAALDDIERQ